MDYRHGVYTREEKTDLTTPVEGTAGLQVIFGVAPYALATAEGSPTEPKLCSGFEDAVAALGYSDDWEKYTLCQSMDASFRAFSVAPVIFVNVLDPDNPDHVEVTAPAEAAFAEHAHTIDTPGVIPQTIAVTTAASSGETLVQGTDYDIVMDSEGAVTILLLAGSDHYDAETLYVSYSSMKPQAVTVDDIIGSYDAATGKRTGLELLNEIYPRFGMTPGIVLAPGFTGPELVAAVEAKCREISGSFVCEAVLDIPADESGAVVYTGVREAKAELGMDSEHIIPCWPMAKIGDKTYAMSALLSALMAQTDAENGDVPYVSPSNKPLQAVALVLKDGTEVVLDQGQANTVNSYGVVTAIAHGSIRAWGNNTAAYPENSDPKDRWIPARRMFSWVRNSIVLTYFQKVDNPMNFRLIESITDSFNIWGNSLVASGYCAACKVRFERSDNPDTELLDGHITFRISFSPYPPAENIEFILTFDTDALTASIMGGEV